MRNWKKEILSIPNILSLFRLLLIPVYTVLFLRAERPVDYWWAAGILAVSTLTDMVDGKIARRFHMVTNLGKILDPVADKATQCTLLVCLAVRHPVLWYVLGLFVVKEGFMLVMGIINLRKRKMLNGALMSGKICTTILFVSMIIPGPKGGLVFVKSTVKNNKIKRGDAGISKNPQKASGRNPQKASARG